MIYNLVCPECGQPFTGNTSRTYCSTACRDAARHRQKAEYNRNRRADRARNPNSARKNAVRDSYLPIRNVREMI